MDTTKPSANFQPQIVQYTPIDRSIEKSVLALVSPSNNSLALVSTKTRANLNFASSTPIAPSPPAAPLPKREPCLPAAGCRSTARQGCGGGGPWNRRAARGGCVGEDNS